MLGIGIGEMIIIAGIALMVIGPEKFPDFAKIAVRTIRDLRGYMEDIQSEVNKELAPVKKELEKLNKIKPEEYIGSLMQDKPEKVAGQSELDTAGSADPTDRQHDGSGRTSSADSAAASDETVQTPADEEKGSAEDPSPAGDTPSPASPGEDFDNLAPPERLD